MPVESVESLSALYEKDETAWLEAMAQLAEFRRVEELDYEHLAEFLNDMARRDRREVDSRLRVLLTHLLKWAFQPEQRSKSWWATLEEQRLQLADVLESKTLRNHAEENLAKAYSRAAKQAAVETDLPASTFPTECPYSIDQLESDDLISRD